MVKHLQKVKANLIKTISQSSLSQKKWKFRIGNGKLKLMIAEYCNESTVHGLKLFNAPNRSRIERAFWAAGLIAAIALICWLISTIYIEFLRAPTATSELPNRISATSIPFPAVGICLGNRISRTALMNMSETFFRLQENITIKVSDSVQKMSEKLLLMGGFFNLAAENIRFTDSLQLHLFLQEIFNGTYSLNDLLRPLYIPCENFIKLCRWQGQSSDCKKLFVNRKTDIGNCCIFNYQRSTIAQLKSFKAGEKALPTSDPLLIRSPGPETGLTIILENDINDYAFFLKSNPASTIFVSDPLDYPATTTGATENQILSPGQEMFLSIHPVPIVGTLSLREVSPKSRGCVFSNEQFSIYDNVYSFSECNLACQAESVIDFCQCYPFNMPSLYNARECLFDDLNCLQQWYSKWNSIDMAINRVRGANNELSSRCPKCMPTCSYNKFNLQSSYGFIKGKKSNSYTNTTLTQNNSVLHVYYGDSFVTEYQQTIIHHWYDLLSMFGGLISLIIGASIISVVELFYFISGKFLAIFFEEKLNPETLKVDDVLYNKYNARFSIAWPSHRGGKKRQLVPSLHSKELPIQKIVTTRVVD